MQGIRFGPFGEDAAHLCIDMQNLVLQPESPWRILWAERVMPQVIALAAFAPAQTIFTRFIPPFTADQMPGAWHRYYKDWANLTQAQADTRLLDIASPLARFVPPAMVFDKPVYSAFAGRRLNELLSRRQVSTLIVSGAETDLCVLASVIGAIDHGHRLILAADAICSSHDHTHDAVMDFYRSRLASQIEIATTEEILDYWHPAIRA